MVCLAFFQPEIPQNTGTLIRLCSCLGADFLLIEPCGFVFDHKKLKRAGMDYVEEAMIKRYLDWEAFYQEAQRKNGRIVLITPDAPCSFLDFTFQEGDILVLGRESTGFPEAIRREVAHQVKIPMAEGRRSLNVALCGAVVLSEALRQLNKYHDA